MIPISQIFGRLGNSMFQMATLYAHSRDLGVDFYFQDPYYFQEHQEAVRALFSTDIPPRTDAIAIHIRRGDYVDNKFYVDLMKTNYYQKAMAKFPNEKFLVFSDDIPWCEKQKIFENCEFSYGNEIEDLNKMASCKGHIIANSSFSWWGAWLCPEYPDNKVIAPKQWYQDGNNSRTILPPQWKRL